MDSRYFLIFCFVTPDILVESLMSSVMTTHRHSTVIISDPIWSLRFDNIIFINHFHELIRVFPATESTRFSHSVHSIATFRGGNSEVRFVCLGYSRQPCWAPGRRRGSPSTNPAHHHFRRTPLQKTRMGAKALATRFTC